MTNKKKKIAVCLSGQLRTWDKCAQNIKSFFRNTDEIECDFFYQTWSQSEIRENSSDFTSGVTNHTAEIISEIDAILEPKKGVIDFPLIPNSLGQPFEFGHRWVNLFHSMRRSFEMMELYEQEQNMSYDMIAKVRFDIVFDPRNIFNSLKHLDEYGFIYCSYFDRPHFEGFNVNLKDVFFFGERTTMLSLVHLSYLESLRLARSPAFQYEFDSQQEQIERDAGPGVIMNNVCEKYSIKYQMFDMGKSNEIIVRDSYVGEPIVNTEQYEAAKKLHEDFYMS